MIEMDVEIPNNSKIIVPIIYITLRKIFLKISVFSAIIKSSFRSVI